jgi:hypothetical protein
VRAGIPRCCAPTRRRPPDAKKPGTAGLLFCSTTDLAYIVWVACSALSMRASAVSIFDFTASPSALSANRTPMPAVPLPCAPVAVTHHTLHANGSRSQEMGESGCSVETLCRKRQANVNPNPIPVSTAAGCAGPAPARPMGVNQRRCGCAGAGRRCGAGLEGAGRDTGLD